MPFIPLEVFANNPSTTVSSGGTSAPAGGTVETWTVASSASFPAVKYGAQQFHVADPVFPNEVIAVQAITGTTWTVMRGAEASPVSAHSAGFTVVQVVTAGDLAGLQFPPWQFSVSAYGAEGDAKIGTGGTGASGQAVMTDAGASFVNATAPAGDVGKYIIVNQGTGSATAATNPFCGTIISVNSATSITLSANLAATCAAAPYIYGTDDAAAINSAVLAASQWAVTTGNYKVQVVFAPALYMLGALVQSTTYGFSPFNTGVNYTYNTHIPVPFTTQYARKMVIDFVGVGDASEPDFWGSAVPSVQGTCLVSAVFPPSQPDATFGQMSVMGAPSTQANIGTGGITNGGFANALVNLNGITAITPFNSQIYGFDFRFAAQANVQNGANTAFAPVNFNAQTVGGTWLRATNIPANGVAVGLAMPVSQNNDNCNVGLFSAEGIAIGTLISEHFTAQRICHIYCNIGFQVTFNPAGTSIHGGSVTYWSCEGCNTGIYASGADSTHQYPFFVGNADFEVINTRWVDDANGCLYGEMYWYDLGAWSPVGAGTLAINYRIINTRMPKGVWSAAVNSGPVPVTTFTSGTSYQNVTYRDVTIWVTSTAAITAIAIGPATGTTVSVAATVPLAVTVPVRVPSGYWFKITSAGGTITGVWVVE